MCFVRAQCHPQIMVHLSIINRPLKWRKYHHRTLLLPFGQTTATHLGNGQDGTLSMDSRLRSRDPACTSFIPETIHVLFHFRFWVIGSTLIEFSFFWLPWFRNILCFMRTRKCSVIAFIFQLNLSYFCKSFQNVFFLFPFRCIWSGLVIAPRESFNERGYSFTVCKLVSRLGEEGTQLSTYKHLILTINLI